jgi:O-antigen/teichoic acid export membrane protein
MAEDKICLQFSSFPPFETMTRSASSGRRNILTNATANWIGFAAQVIVTFFLTPILVNSLGLERYGIWSLVEAILAYLVLLDFGVGASVVRFVAKFETTRDYPRVNRVFNTSIAVFAVAGFIGCVLAAAAAFFLLPLFDRIQKYPELAWEGRWLLVLFGINLGFGLPLKVFTCVLDALGRYPAQMVVRLLVLMVRSGLLVWVASNGGGLVPLGIVIVVCSLAEHVILAAVAWWYLPELRFARRFIHRDTFAHMRGYSLDAFVAMIAGRILFQTDAIVIGAFLPLRQITFFTTAARLVEYSKDSFRAITTGLMPAVSVLEAKGDLSGIRQILFNGTRYVLWLVVPVQLGLIILGHAFLSLWMWREPEIAAQGYPVLWILAVPLSLSLAQAVAARILYGVGQLRWFSRAAMAEAVANLALSITLAPSYGIVGVAVGTAIPNIIGSIALVVYVCRYLDANVLSYLRYAFVPPMLAAVPLALAWAATTQAIDVDRWYKLILIGLTGLAAYLFIGALVEWGPRRLASILSRRPIP